MCWQGIVSVDIGSVGSYFSRCKISDQLPELFCILFLTGLSMLETTGACGCTAARPDYLLRSLQEVSCQGSRQHGIRVFTKY